MLRGTRQDAGILHFHDLSNDCMCSLEGPNAQNATVRCSQRLGETWAWRYQKSAPKPQVEKLFMDLVFFAFWSAKLAFGQRSAD